MMMMMMICWEVGTWIDMRKGQQNGINRHHHHSIWYVIYLCVCLSMCIYVIAIDITTKKPNQNKQTNRVEKDASAGRLID